MIPQNFKDILANVQNAGVFQTLALALFILVFAGIVFYVFSKPKKYYNDMENAPLDDNEKEQI